MTPSSGHWTRVILVGAAGFLLLATGCRWEKVDPGPSPTPSPTPGPTPTPTPIPTPTPFPTPDFRAESFSADEPASALAFLEQSFTHQVAYANAALIEHATREARDGVRRFQEILHQAQSTSAGNLGKAESAFEAARRAFFQAEAALYYTAPGEVPDWEALFAQASSGEPAAFAEVRRLLVAYDGAPDDRSVLPSVRSTVLQELVSAAEQLEKDLTRWADAWGGEAAFRRDVFLADPSVAIGRVFQGMVAALDLVVEEGGALEPDSERLKYRLRGVQNIWTGLYPASRDALNFGAGLSVLVDSTSPFASAEISRSLETLLNPASGVGETPEGGTFLEAATALRGQILRTATELGYGHLAEPPL